jgi:hypothetical protein
MREKNVSIAAALILIISLILIPTDAISSNTATTLNDGSPFVDAWLTFTISTPGQNGKLSLTLKSENGLFYSGGDWEARSGDNYPANESIKNVGPIPHGTWWVWQRGAKSDHPNWYYLEPDPTTNTYGRSGFYIHGYGTMFNGCIAVINFDNFVATLQTYQIVQDKLNTHSLRLNVVYYRRGRGGGGGGGPCRLK